EGVLVRSLREGKWVIFEDIDRGSNEVLGVIKPLVESLRLGKWIGGRASLQVPTRGRVVAADSFALFATRSVAPSRTGTLPSPTFFGAHKFHEILISSPTSVELRTILDSRFPSLAGSANFALIRLWEAVRTVGPAASTRDVGLRELEKFCTRIQRLLPSSYQPMDMDTDDSTTSACIPLSSLFPNPTLREEMYLEARDVFFGAGSLTASARSHSESIANIIAEHLGLEADRRSWVLNGRTPEFDLEKDVNGNITAVRVGRTYLPARQTKMAISQAPTRPFAMHKPAVVLLSRIATAVSLSEPVLLTGETGTGKTSVVEKDELKVSAESWAAFVQDVEQFEVQHVHGKGKFAFGFVEGPLVKALRSGDWVLLDEINLASPETLECISGLLHGPTASITLTEQGSLEPVPRHPDFRLFACMNPATDVGKKDLPPNIRSRFTEIDVPPPDADKETLLSIVTQYIGSNALGDKGAIMNVAEFYAGVKDLAEKRQIADGSNHRPHFSMRTLARALTFASDTASIFPLRRAIWEGCLMAFTMVLDAPSAELVTALAQKHLLAGVRNPRSMLMKEPQVPHSRSADDFIKLGPFYLERGPLPEDPAEDYIITPSVETKLIDLARIVLTRRFPILIEGPTSAGKTSSVEYLAKRTGHRFIRINNHEHTDIQEYIGSYVSDPQTGKLVFKDGLLVRALRNGDWIVLDELNLAPTDVLEALNRLLDDNRELVIPETHEVVKPHPHFMLFATQNPPGLYAGRKVLSRAFRNRFLEVHFEDVPQAELETILCQRCQIAPSYGKRIVSVFHELQKRRQTGRVFESKQGFATLRDLFRWAGRDAVGYQELAENGYMLLAERARRDDDKAAVKEVIESVMNVKIDESLMYKLHRPDVDMSSFLGCPVPEVADVIWTSAMQRLFVLVSRALRFNEPVLLVGETGAGKTSVCQVFANATSQRLHGLNCHQNTETADLIGGLRPLRNRTSREAEILRESVVVLQEIGMANLPQTVDELSAVLSDVLKSETLSLHHPRIQALLNKLLQLQAIFEWHDGPLVEAMRHGDVFLLDEISLADDSVLERLNSVLEPGRTIVLAEKGGADEFAHPALRADENFKLVATMNPGGDYGKKELSPALRNRFTEIWVPRVEDRRDLELIVRNLWKHDALRDYTPRLLDFIDWLCARVGDRSLTSLRDILAWVAFSNAAFRPESLECMPGDEVFHHAAHMTFLDGLGSLPQLSAYTKDGLQQLKDESMSKLMDLVPLADRDALFTYIPPYDPSQFVQIGSFSIAKGSQDVAEHVFNLQAPTTQDNAMRVVRACQLLKPILLEGSPGVGKTSLVTALANITGHHLCRINLSDQTDIIDLFGSDLPVEGGSPGEFAWKDAEFLKALQEGHWVLLDEMNLAPQAVLEGLNAVLDHRGTVYIPELGRSFVRHPNFRIFAAQNPLQQGGGRKGLPKSFVNRFTKVYVEELSPSDLLLVCQHLFPDFDDDTLRKMIAYNMQLQEAVGVQRRFAREGSPWEFNLRDVIRWASLLRQPQSILPPSEHLHTIYLHRFRTDDDRLQARVLFDKVFSTSSNSHGISPNVTMSSSHLQVGHFIMERRNAVPLSPPGRLLKMQLSSLESIGHSVSQSWLTILTGQRNSGKTDIVRVLSHFTGNILQEISVNSATDTMDILGSFEQVDLNGRALFLIDEVLSLFDHQMRSTSGLKSNYNRINQLRKARQETTSYHSLLQLASECFPTDASGSALELLTKVNDLISTGEAVGRFEWVDGPLVRAMKSGQWLLLDGANLCNPSVLDRLNSLCEHNGVLTLSERGYVNGKVEVLKPHPEFRLFMTVDPQFGELSRAMRNRGIEISLITLPMADDANILCDFRRLPSSSSSGEGPKISGSAFETIRRGLCQSFASHNVSMTTSGRALDQDTSLSNLIDSSPMFYASSEKEFSDADLFFIARSTAPACVGPFNRWLAVLRHSSPEFVTRVQALLSTLANSVMNDVFVRLREAYSLSLVLPSDFVFAQPMDFFLNAPPCIDKKLDSDAPSMHSIVLETLNLSVALFLHSEDKASMLMTGKVAETSNKKREALKHIAAFMEAIQLAAQSTLQSVVPENDVVQTHKALCLSSTLLTYARYLQKIASATALDFSALLATCRWIIDALDASSSSFPVVSLRAQDLINAISPSSGLGIQEIWSALIIDRSSLSSSTNLDLLGSRCARLVGKEAQDLRRQTFDLMALKTLPINLPLQSDEKLEALRMNLESHLLEQKVDDDDENVQEDSSLLIAELGLLTTMTSAETSSKRVADIIETACGQKADVIPIIAEVQMQWLNALWNNSILASVVSTFGDDLLARFSSVHPATEGTINTFTANAASRDSRNMVAECFRSSLPAACSSLFESVPKTIHELKSYSNAIVTLAQQSSHEPFQRAITLHLNPALQRLNTSRGRGDLVQNMGLVWISLGGLLLDLFVPDTPLDPATIGNCTVERKRQEQRLIQLQLHLHRTLEELTTGNDESDLIHHLKEIASDISTQLESAPSFPSRSDVARLNMFWSEVVQFQTHVLSHSKIDQLTKLLLSKDNNASAREEVLQQSIAGFYHRLVTVYTDYPDLSAPLRLAILYVRMGFRLVSHIAALDPTQLSSTQAFSLAAFPSVKGSGNICKFSGTAGPPAIAPFRYVLLTLTAVVKEKLLGVWDMNALETVYDQALRLWLIDRAKEKEADMASSSLYRRKNLDHEDIGEAEMEEKEFLELFPSFDDVFDPDASKTTTKNKPAALVPGSEISQLVSLHHKLFGKSPVPSNSSGFKEARQSLLTSLLTSSAFSSLSETLDDESLPFQFEILHDRVAALENIPVIGDSYNFYLDPNVAQVRQAATVVSSMRARLDKIIQEWPDQMVLQHLRERCDAVLGLNLHSPIAKVLSALEQLLLQTEDWEMYANRENTLRTNQQALIGLIVEWRRLELSCWKALLESQSKAFAEGADEWWFRLYDATIRGPLDSCDHEDGSNRVEQYLDTLIPLLDDFLRTSPLGEFDARIRLLDTFERYALHLRQNKEEAQRSTLDRVCRVLNSTRCYYELFSDQISSQLAAQRASLEKEIRNFIKLASWKDINVQALKASAQRTHHQLYKIVRKFRDVLRQPITAQLQPQLAEAPETKQLDFESMATAPQVMLDLPDGELRIGASNRLVQIGNAFKKFDSFITDSIQSFIGSKSARVVDDLAVDIIVGARELAALSVPSNLPAEKRQKQQKALLVRKRKGLSDLLKELKRAGFSVNVKPDVLVRNANSRWLREQPVLPETDEPSLSTQKGEIYLNRLLGILPNLRSSTSNHHSDLTTRELQRGIMFLESGFHMGIALRAQLATGLEQLLKLKHVAKRFSMICTSSKPVQAGASFADLVNGLKNVLSRMSDAFAELLESLRTYDSLQPKTLVPEYLRQEVGGLHKSTFELLDRVSLVKENMGLTALTVLLEDEHATILEARTFISNTVGTLQNWSFKHSDLRYLFEPIEKWLESQELPLLATHPLAAISPDASDAIINTFLVTVQNLVAKCPASVAESEEEDKDHDHYLSSDQRLVCDFTRSLNMDTVIAGLQNVLLHLITYPDQCMETLRRVMPFLDAYTRLARNQLAIHSQWTKAVFKLDYILCSVFTTLATQGFCQPPDTEDGGEAEGNDMKDATGGVGIGEGSGTENVSKDIEDESQVEGLKGEDTQEERNNKDERDDKDDDALEMNEDFGGEMEDVPDDESQDGSGSDNESDAEPEEQLGGLDPSDPSAVDEKMWGDEKGPENEGEEEKDNQDHSHEQSGESEVVAKEGKNKEKKEKGSKEKENDVAKDQPPSTEDEPMEEAGDEENEDDSGKPDDGGAPMDPHAEDRIPETGAEPQNSESHTAGTASSGVQEGQLPSQPDEQAATNPLRSLGDALKEIQQRFDDILNSEQRDVPREHVGDVNAPSQVEYLQPDDADHDMEALGPAGEEQVAKLKDLKLVDGDQGEQSQDYGPMDIDLPLEPDAQKSVHDDGPSKLDAELSAPEQRNDVEGAILQHAHPIKNEVDFPSNDSNRKADVDMDDSGDETVEAELRTWQSSGFPDAGAEKVWRLYESLTHDLAYALCEQLRLILEPTLATRLKGDYRTGKRLNMKKIISYIASDYTKDKIWLRRTRPSQREYQVLISIDDSRSMAESHSIHLAYQTLALVSKALSRLEAGDIAIAKFGETVDVLHGFDEGPFTDQSGIKVMSAFRFNQKATNVLSLVETSLKVLENARERRSMSSATASDLWQLQFIISDGMCQDHERLQTVLRKAEEQRVMIVFVIIDSLHNAIENASSGNGGNATSHQGSILTMDKAEFKNVDGRMELQLKKYLDSFPFEYYVVLRNVEALPEVLAGTLKQFFERISEE
ncbi:hypothetical protein H0H93_009563, partial [Arthromyces matolae]